MSEPLSQGLLLSAIGMSMVFAALAALWALIALIGYGGNWLERRSQAPVAPPAPAPLIQTVTPSPSDEEMAAIGLALLLHAQTEDQTGLRWRLPPLLTRWVAIGYGRQLHSWQPPRGRHRHNR
ncbi:MAG: OadG family transporter subunit [Caldilineales bacterium]